MDAEPRWTLPNLHDLKADRYFGEAQILGSGIVGKCFTQLLHDQALVGWRVNLPMHDSPPSCAITKKQYSTLTVNVGA